MLTIEDQRTMDQLNQSLYLYQFLMEQWNDKDFPEVSLFIQGKNYKQVAQVLKKDESSTWRREKSLGIKAYNTCKKLIGNIVENG